MFQGRLGGDCREVLVFRAVVSKLIVGVRSPPEREFERGVVGAIAGKHWLTRRCNGSLEMVGEKQSESAAVEL